MSPVTLTLDTPKKLSNVEKEEQEVKELDKDTSVDISAKGQEGPNESGPHIEVNKDEKNHIWVLLLSLALM